MSTITIKDLTTEQDLTSVEQSQIGGGAFASFAGYQPSLLASNQQALPDSMQAGIIGFQASTDAIKTSPSPPYPSLMSSIYSQQQEIMFNQARAAEKLKSSQNAYIGGFSL